MGAPVSKEDAAFRKAFGERLEKLCGLTGVPITALSHRVGLKAKGHLGNVVREGNALATEHAAKIVRAEFKAGRVNGHWLLTGEGSPFLPAPADDADPCPNRALALSRLAGVCSYSVLGHLRDMLMGPEADIPVTDWIQLALEMQLEHDGGRSPRRPVTAPPHSSGVQESRNTARRDR